VRRAPLRVGLCYARGSMRRSYTNAIFGFALWLGACTADDAAETPAGGDAGAPTTSGVPTTGDGETTAASSSTNDDDGAEASTGSTGGTTAAGDETAQEDAVVPAFALMDLNPTSTTFEQPVSPRDYLEKVSGWYFTEAT
jgi:hypothetical protein